MAKKRRVSKKESGIITGMREALAHARGNSVGAVVHEFPTLVDVVAIRERQGMTQAEFCKTYGFALDALRNWEQNRRRPEGPARALLAVIDHDANAVLTALWGKA